MRIFISISILFIFLATSCGNNEESTPKKEQTTVNLDGSWVIKRGVGKFADRQIDQVFTFNGDRFQFNHKQLSFTGTAAITDKTFTITVDKGNQPPKTFNYSIVGDTMILNMQNSVMTFYLVKL